MFSFTSPKDTGTQIALGNNVEDFKSFEYTPSTRRSSASDTSSYSISSSPRLRSQTRISEGLRFVYSSRESSPLRSASETPPPSQDSRRRLPCLITGCIRRFTNQYTLKVHMEAHKPKPRASFPCTLGCAEHFSRQHDRLRHEVAKHGKICEFICNDCGRFFSTKKTMGNHKCPMAQGGTRWVSN